MHALSLYLDTSVIGGYFDKVFMADTHALWKLRDSGVFRFVSFDLVVDEISGAPETVRQLMRTSFVAEDVLVVSEEMENLAAASSAMRLYKDPYLVLYRVDEARRVVSVQHYRHAKRDPQALHAD